MESTFIKAPLITTHVGDPALAWNAMMTLNDGGIARLSHYLARVSTREVKLERINELLNEVLHELIDNRLGRWFHQDGMGEVEAKRKIAQQVVTALTPRIRLLGEIQQQLQLSDSELHNLYLGAGVDAQEEAQETIADTPSAVNLGDDPFGLGDALDLFGDAAATDTTSKKAIPSGSDARFAKLVLSAWFEHLRSVPSDEQLLTYFGLPLELS